MCVLAVGLDLCVTVRIDSSSVVNSLHLCSCHFMCTEVFTSSSALRCGVVNRPSLSDFLFMSQQKKSKEKIHKQNCSIVWGVRVCLQVDEVCAVSG